MISWQHFDHKYVKKIIFFPFFPSSLVSAEHDCTPKHQTWRFSGFLTSSQGLHCTFLLRIIIYFHTNDGTIDQPMLHRNFGEFTSEGGAPLLRNYHKLHPSMKYWGYWSKACVKLLISDKASWMTRIKCKKRYLGTYKRPKDDLFR